MRVTDKLNLIDKIGRALQSRFGYGEIDAFLAEYGIKPPHNVTSNSKWVYSKAALQGAPLDIIIKVADELDLGPSAVQRGIVSPPQNWKDTKLFRLFISHLAKDKEKATRLKDCLAQYAISGFVAHEDIHPTLEWQTEIERALFVMDGFVSIHTIGFSASVFGQQEIGVAIGRGVKIIPLKMGEDPKGFLSKRQALPRRSRPAEEVAQDIDRLLIADDLTNARLTEAKESLRPQAKSWSQLLDEDVPF